MELAIRQGGGARPLSTNQCIICCFLSIHHIYVVHRPEATQGGINQTPISLGFLAVMMKADFVLGSLDVG